MQQHVAVVHPASMIVTAKLRIGIGALLFEGNSFSNKACGIVEFENRYLLSGHRVVEVLASTNAEVAGALVALDSAEIEIVPLFAAQGGSGGHVTAECHRVLRDGMLSALEAAGPLDGIYLALHGAMICEGVDDPEGELLVAVRNLAGLTPVVVSCDLHAHITQAMLENCRALIGYQHYPHDDTYETGIRAAGLLKRIVRGDLDPRMAFGKLPAVVPPFAQGTKERSAMRELFALCRGLEAGEGVLALSYFPVQPWMDIPGLGFTVVAVTDGNDELARSAVQRVLQAFWERRDRFQTPQITVEDGLQKGREIPSQPVILAEIADCVGGGAGGDSVHVLRRYLDIAEPASLLLHVVDPDAVQQAKAYGAGATFICDLGHRIDPAYGTPLRAEATVQRIFDGHVRYRGGAQNGVSAQLGDCAVLSIGSATVLVATHGAYEYGDESFVSAGLDPRDFKFVVVKNPMNFKAAYDWAPAYFVVRTFGATTAAFEELDWKRRLEPCFPMQDVSVPAGGPIISSVWGDVSRRTLGIRWRMLDGGMCPPRYGQKAQNHAIRIYCSAHGS